MIIIFIVFLANKMPSKPLDLTINGTVHDIIWSKYIYDSVSHGNNQEDVFPLERRTQNRKNDYNDRG